MKKKLLNYNYLVYNKSINQKYYIKNKLEAGIVLYGWEVKSLRANKVSINDGYVLIRQNEAYLINVNIQPLTYTASRLNVIKQDRNRKLLLNKYEIKLLDKYTNTLGYSAVVFAVYIAKSWIKIKLAVVKGKKEYDKRASLKKREWSINKDRILKNSKKYINT